jgi:hypothetical protein
MSCRHLSGWVTQRHDHHIMARAGLHSAAEPHLGLARRKREAQRGVESRRDFTTPMSSGVVGNVSIVHPAASFFVAAAATMTGAAARSRDASSMRTTHAVASTAGTSSCPSLWSPSGAWGRRHVPCYAATPTWRPTAAASPRQRSLRALYRSRAWRWPRATDVCCARTFAGCTSQWPRVPEGVASAGG